MQTVRPLSLDRVLESCLAIRERLCSRLVRVVDIAAKLVLAVCTLCGSSIYAAPRPIHRPNVLFIMVDDLRPALGCYGDEIAHSPNIDRLARRGVVFQRAYCQQAVCCPSRLSLLTGRRPDTIHVWDLKTHFRDAKPNIVTLPQSFKQLGFVTQSVGKILHGSGKPSKDPPSWTETPVYDYVRDPKLRYALPKNLSGDGLKRASSEAANVPDDHYIDGKVCEEAIAALRKLKSQRSKSFFLAVGFRKPHLPFCAPRKYWDLYKRDGIPLPRVSEHPEDAPELATRSWKELEGYSDIPDDGKLSTQKVRELRHGYYACVSYVDALVGRLLDELESLEMADDTVIVLVGDHGFHLGEQGLWAKANNYELSTRVPLIICAPSAGISGSNNELVELVDIYPTIADLCHLSSDGLEGISLRPLLFQPNGEHDWKRAVFSQYPRANSAHRHKGHGDIMGYTVRTKRFRYVEWQRWNDSGDHREVVATELYDHRTDPQEAKNVADSAAHKDVVLELSDLLRAGWKEARPRFLRVN